MVTVVSNPLRYYARYKLYQAFAKMVEEAGGILYTVELALRDRHFEVTDPQNPAISNCVLPRFSGTKRI